MGIHLSAIHYVYLVFIVFILALLIRRRDTTMICVAGIFALGLLATSTVTGSVSGIFNSFIYATKELMGTIMIISIIVAMSRILIITGINETMVAPLTRFLRTPAMAYWGIGLIMMVTSFSSGLHPLLRWSVLCCSRWRSGSVCRHSGRRWR